MLGHQTEQKMYITPEEAVKLSNDFCTLQDMQIGCDIFQEWKKTASEDVKNSQVSDYFLYAVLFECGRMQGMREERAKRK